MELKKKIAVLCDYRLMSERLGGMDRFFWLFDSECKAMGHQIVWFFPNNPRVQDYSQLTIVTDNGKSVEQIFIDYNQSFDVVITHFLELCTSFYKTVKKEMLAAKIITVDHNPRPLGGYAFKKRIQKRMKGLLYSRYIDLYIGVSQYTLNEILKDFGDHLSKKSIVIYNGIEYQKFKQSENRATYAPKFLVACHLRYSKGIQDLIDAVALLSKNILAQLQIDVYGEGENQTVLENKIKENNLLENFVFKGSVPNLHDIYFQYDYLLQPTHMECFSLAILESLSANVPVITTPVGGNEEVIKNGINGFILPVKNPQAWCDLISKLYQGEMKISGDTSELIATEFSIEKMVSKYIKLL